MFFEQYSHEPYIAVSRFWYFAGLVEQNRDMLAEKMERGYHALGVMDDHLMDRTYLVGGRYTLANIALYTYTHVAHEGGLNSHTFLR